MASITEKKKELEEMRETGKNDLAKQSDKLQSERDTNSIDTSDNRYPDDRSNVLQFNKKNGDNLVEGYKNLVKEKKSIKQGTGKEKLDDEKPAGKRKTKLSEKAREVLGNPVKLRKLYKEDRLSAPKIAKLLGCGTNCVYKYTKLYNINTDSGISEKAREVLENPVKLRKLYKEDRLSAPKIAKLLGCGRSSVYSYLELHSINTRPRISKKTREVLEDSEKLQKLYKKEKSAPKIAKLLKCNTQTVYNSLHRQNILFPRSTGPQLSEKTRAVLEYPEKLQKLYEEDGLTVPQIAETFGCSISTVNNYLYRYTITTSRGKLSEKTREVLEDPEKLRKLYEEDGLSAPKIAEILGCGYSKVYQYLEYHDITPRSQTEARLNQYMRSSTTDIPISKKIDEYLAGSLLGDGFLSDGTYLSGYSLGSIHKEYTEFVARLLNDNGYTMRISESINAAGNWFYTVFTSATFQLHNYRTNWYPEGKKIVPEDVKLTPLTCLHWYLQDGTRDVRKKANGEKYIATISLLTFAFPRKQVEMLTERLREILDCDDIVHAKRNKIRLNKKASHKFLKYIGGKPPTTCFNYKFDPDSAVTKPEKAI
ncbi:MAG: helix-turn-helix domain-containing protein [Candidatus Odinarchaeota archaeon]